jgi:hypothetical protein
MKPSMTIKTFLSVDPNTRSQQETNKPVQFTLAEFLLGGSLVGLITALGVPKIITLLAQNKVEAGTSERRREDSIYQTLVNGYQENQKSLIQTNASMMANQVSATSELFQMNASLINELKGLRGVVQLSVDTNTKIVQHMEMLLHKVELIEALLEEKTDITLLNR